jgi:transposase InsO family protein
VILHRNAKTTPHMRALLVRRIRRQRWSPRRAAAAAGISVRSTYKWLARYREGGRAALQDRPSTPHRQPHRTKPAVTARILAARATRQTAWAIAVRLQVPRSTVAAILARAGLNRLAQLTAAPPVHRYEWPRRGDLVHLDVKPLARIAGVGHRIHGDRRTRVTGIGWEYAHVAVDDHSRAAYVEVLPDQTGPTTAGFLDRTVAWFAQRGVRITRVLTDNGGNYRSRQFLASATRHQLRLKRARPYRPQTNGKAERFIQTLIREWAYARPYTTSLRRTRALSPWVRAYNTVRPHTALDYQPPRSRFPRVAQ